MNVRSGGEILLVDDDTALLRLLSIRLQAAGYEVSSATSAGEALSALTTYEPDLLISDLRMEQMDGLGLLDEIQRSHPGLPVLLITAHGTIPDAVAATQRGAFGFLTKPIDSRTLLDQVDRAIRLTGAERSSDNWRAEIITRSPAMEVLLGQARLVADSDTSVLITGASGTGKELLARAIHEASSRSHQAFVAINCGAIPEHLLESELFGHEKGAFTGAISTRQGLFQAANGGTLFLDEIGDMPLALQVKLLRTLQDRCIRPVGSITSINVDVRVISATHKDLRQALRDNEFREDLYYRLNVVNLAIPPLSERREDIPLIVTAILERLAARNGATRKVYSPPAMDLLVSADWPGNVRQLVNVVEQNFALCPAPVIGPRQVEQALGEISVSLPSYNEARDAFTRDYLAQLLRITRGNVSRAARIAKRNRTDFYKLLAKYQLESTQFKAQE